MFEHPPRVYTHALRWRRHWWTAAATYRILLCQWRHLYVTEGRAYMW